MPVVSHDFSYMCEQQRRVMKNVYRKMQGNLASFQASSTPHMTEGKRLKVPIGRLFEGNGRKSGWFESFSQSCHIRTVHAPKHLVGTENQGDRTKLTVSLQNIDWSAQKNRKPLLLVNCQFYGRFMELRPYTGQDSKDPTDIKVHTLGRGLPVL